MSDIPHAYELGSGALTAPESELTVREATEADWEAIWPFMRRIVAAGETFSWDRDIAESDARAGWMHEDSGRTFVAVDGDGQVVGTAELEPNHVGPGSHVATAGFMVDPDFSGRGAGRALGRHVVGAAWADGYRAMQFNAVVETNTRAVALWQSLGFEVVATIPEAFDHPQYGFVGLLVMYQKL